MATINITTSMGTININNNTDQIINPSTGLLNNNSPNVYISTKVCNTCRTIKYLIEFYKDKSKHDGYRSQCKNCHNNQKKIYAQENKDKIANKRKEYYVENKDIIADQRKDYYEQNKDIIAIHQKKIL